MARGEARGWYELPPLASPGALDLNQRIQTAEYAEYAKENEVNTFTRCEYSTPFPICASSTWFAYFAVPAALLHDKFESRRGRSAMLRFAPVPGPGNRSQMKFPACKAGTSVVHSDQSFATGQPCVECVALTGLGILLACYPGLQPGLSHDRPSALQIWRTGYWQSCGRVKTRDVSVVRAVSPQWDSLG